MNYLIMKLIVNEGKELVVHSRLIAYIITFYSEIARILK